MTVTNNLAYETNGTLADADDINSDKSFILNNMLNFALDGATITSQNNLVTKTSFTTGVDLVNTTGFLFGTKYYAKSTGTPEEVTFDDFEDGSIAAFWTDGSTTEGTGTATVTETGGELRIRAYGSGSTANTGSALVYQNTGTNLLGKTCVINYNSELTTSTDTNTEVGYYMAVTDGTNHVILYSVYYNDSLVNDIDTNYKVKFQPSATNPDTKVEVFLDSGAGYVSQGDVDVSSLSLGKMRFRLYSTAVGGNPSGNSTANLDLKHIWIDNYEASVLVTTDNTIASSDLILTNLKYDSTLSSVSSTTNYVSIDSGSNYSSALLNSVLNKLASAGTTYKIKYDLAYSNTTPTAMTTSVVSGYGFYYD